MATRIPSHVGRVSSVSGISGSPLTIARFTYYKNDLLNSTVYGNRLTQAYRDDVLGRASNITLYDGVARDFSLAYLYTANGNVASVNGQVSNTTVSESYSYDPLNRLTSANVRNGNTNTTLSYNYDSVGNRLSQTQNNIVTSYSYNLANNELMSYSVQGSTVPYGYDANGNMVSRNDTSTSHWSYAWDVPGNLLKVSNGTNVQGYYAYDGLGRLLESMEGSSTLFYAYLGTDTLASQGASGNPTDYVYAGGMRIARVTGYTANNPVATYYHTDALGSTRLVTSASKTVLFSDSYQPYGQDNGTPTGSETYKFTGKPYSSATGLYYNYHRWYDPATGRFISQDPVGGWSSDPQSANSYVYALNSPTTLLDPTGAFVSNPGQDLCVDVCGGQREYDNTAAAFILPSMVEIHRWGSIGFLLNLTPRFYSCGRCGGGGWDGGGYRTPDSGEPPATTNTVRIGGIRPVEIGKIGVENAEGDLSSVGYRIVDEEVGFATPLGRRVVDITAEEASGGPAAIEVKYSSLGRPASWSSEIQTQIDKDVWIRAEYNIRVVWYLRYGGNTRLIEALISAGIPVLGG